MSHEFRGGDAWLANVPIVTCWRSVTVFNAVLVLLFDHKGDVAFVDHGGYAPIYHVCRLTFSGRRNVLSYGGPWNATQHVCVIDSERLW